MSWMHRDERREDGYAVECWLEVFVWVWLEVCVWVWLEVCVWMRTRRKGFRRLWAAASTPWVGRQGVVADRKSVV